VVYAQLKYMWADGAKEETLHHLRAFTASLAKDIQQESGDRGHRPNVSKNRLAELNKLLARCYLKQGEWQMVLKDDWNAVSDTL
jgi:serine/threonine-protein kinase mTOR